MLSLAKLIGADIILLSDGSSAGSVRDVYFDENCRKIVYFAISSPEGDLLLPHEAALSVRDAVMTEDALPLLSPADADLTPLVSAVIGKKICTAGGTLKGEAHDVLFSARGKVNAVLTDDGEYSPSAFRVFGDVLILKEGAGRRRKKKPVPFPAAESDYPVSLLAAAAPPADDAGVPALPVMPPQPGVAAESTEEFTPYRVIADYNFLLGRTLADDLVAYSGETLAKRGERVTTELVERARRHGKLMDLTLSSR